MNEDGRLIRFDWAIKKILREKANFDILEGFLSALLGYDVTILNLLESEGNKEHQDDKYNRVDLLAEDDLGSRILIEVQVNREIHYLERLLYGSSKLVVETLLKGDEYKNVKKVISVSILYFNFGDEADDYVYYGSTEFRGLHSHTPLRIRRKEKGLYRNMESREIFPEYYLIEVEKFKDIIESDLDEWVYFFKNERVMESFKAKNIHKASEKLEIMKMPHRERQGYYRYLENLAIEKDILTNTLQEGLDLGLQEGHELGLKAGRELGLQEGLELGVKEGHEMGLKEGEVLGHEKGIKEGLELGLKEGVKKGQVEVQLKVASQLLGKGFSAREIADISGLSIEEIEKLMCN